MDMWDIIDGIKDDIEIVALARTYKFGENTQDNTEDVVLNDGKED